MQRHIYSLLQVHTINSNTSKPVAAIYLDVLQGNKFIGKFITNDNGNAFIEDIALNLEYTIKIHDPKFIEVAQNVYFVNQA